MVLLNSMIYTIIEEKLDIICSIYDQCYIFNALKENMWFSQREAEDTEIMQEFEVSDRSIIFWGMGIFM